jgi:hypothetical protein
VQVVGGSKSLNGINKVHPSPWKSEIPVAMPKLKKGRNSVIHIIYIGTTRERQQAALAKRLRFDDLSPSYVP